MLVGVKIEIGGNAILNVRTITLLRNLKNDETYEALLVLYEQWVYFLDSFERMH